MRRFLESQIRKRIDTYRKRKGIKKLLKKYNKTKNKSVFLLQTPIHTNIGDQAIAQAEVDFITSYLDDYTLFEINQAYLDMFCERFEHIIRDDDLLMLHGGGNMGDQYLNEEEHRRKVVQTFPKNKIVIFPQTFYFTDTKQGKEQLRITKDIFSKHDSLTVVAREVTSYKLMQREFPGNNILLTPDIVLSMNKANPALKREGLLLVLRNDVEKMLSDERKSEILDISRKIREKVIVSDMYHDRNVYSENERKEVLENKFKQFKQAEVVITDRLHGMIFAAITQTPCIAFTNYNQKVSGTYEWIKQLNYIRFVDLNADVELQLQELLTLEKKTEYHTLDIIDKFKEITAL